MALSQFTSLQLIGTTLLTSAGVAGLIFGIAAQPVLANIMAGVQVAITQPVRIGDSVFIEDNWGYVEDLRYTYAVIRTWDERRLVIPLRYLISEPYENWTLKDAHLIKPIYLYADYRTDVQKITREVRGIAYPLQRVGRAATTPPSRSLPSPTKPSRFAPYAAPKTPRPPGRSTVDCAKSSSPFCRGSRRVPTCPEAALSSMKEKARKQKGKAAEADLAEA